MSPNSPGHGFSHQPTYIPVPVGTEVTEVRVGVQSPRVFLGTDRLTTRRATEEEVAVTVVT